MTLIKSLMLGLLFIAMPALAKVQVFACEPEWKALADVIGGEHVKSYSATTAFQDPHYIEARPSLIAKVRRADMVFCTGAELEIGWLPLLLRQSGNAKIQENKPGYFLATSVVELIDIPLKLDRSQGDVHAEGNPHVHWDPYRLVTIAKVLSQRLSTIDPANANFFQQRYEDYAAKWQTAITKWEAQAASLQGKKVIVYHKNWSYLLDWLNVDIVGDLEPKPGIPPTSAHLASLLKSIASDKPDVILIANYQDDKGARWLSKKAGIPVIRLPFTVGGSQQANSLQALYDEVLTTLVSKS